MGFLLNALTGNFDLSGAGASAATVADLVTLTGVPVNSTNLGTFTGSIISDNNTIKGALQQLETTVESLPDPISYQGTWSAATNTPTLLNTDTGKLGYLYQVNAAGSVNFGAGAITFEVGDKVVNNGTIWEKWDMTDAVASVNSYTGVVVLATNDIAISGSTFNKALVSNGSGFIAESAVTATELGYVSGVTSSIQTQLNAKQSTTLTDSHILVGNASNIATDVAVTGDVIISNTGVTAISSGVIVNADVNASAAIDFSKLATLTSGNILLGSVGNVATSTAVTGDVVISNAGVTAISSGVIVDADINASAAIAVTKLATVTASRALVSDASGFISAATTTSTEIGYVNGVTSAIQTQIDNIVAGTTPLTLTDAHIFVGNASNDAVDVAVTGDVTISNTGVTAISSGVIVDADINTAAAIDASKIADGTVSSIEFQYINSLTSNAQTQLNGKQATGNYITDLTGDATATGPGSVAITLATVNGNVGSFGSSTSIPSFTVNAKGLITAASGNAVIAPADTLTGTTLASNVVTSSLTSVGTITSGTWNGTTIAIANGGTGQTTKAAAFDALSPMTTAGDIIYGGASGTGTRLAAGTSGFVLQSNGAAAPTWVDPSSGGNFGAALYQGYWAGTAGIYWTDVTTGSWQEWAATGTPVLTEANNDNFGTVTTAATARPGLAFTAPNTGTIEVDFTGAFYNQGSAITQVRIVNGAGTMVGTPAVYYGVLDRPVSLKAFMAVTASTAYELRLQVYTATTANIGNLGTVESMLSASMKYVK